MAVEFGRFGLRLKSRVFFDPDHAIKLAGSVDWRTV